MPAYMNENMQGTLHADVAGLFRTRCRASASEGATGWLAARVQQQQGFASNACQ